VTLRVILLFVMALLVLRAVGRFMGGLSQAARGEAPRARTTEVPVKMVKDPVCGTFVVPGKGPKALANGATVWFCSDQCRDTFTRRG
jgi:YHS domain-containing protein